MADKQPTQEQIKKFCDKYGYKSVEEMSILHLGILARQLGINADGIRNKHLDALGNELLKAIKTLP